MVLPDSPSVGYSRVSLLSSGWAAPLAPRSTAGGSSLMTRKPTPIPPKRSFASPSSLQSAMDGSKQQLTAVTLSPFTLSPLQAGARLMASPYSTPDSCTHRLVVPSSTPSIIPSPCSTPQLNVRHCLPLAASPMSGSRPLPLAPPSSPAISVVDKLTHSAAFKQLIQQQHTRAECGVDDECTAHAHDGSNATLTSSDEKRRSPSNNGRHAVDWMPVLVE